MENEVILYFCLSDPFVQSPLHDGSIHTREREREGERWGREREVGGGERELKLSNTVGGERGGRIGGKSRGRLISGVFFTAHCSAFSVRHLKYLLHCSLMKMPT